MNIQKQFEAIIVKAKKDENLIAEDLHTIAEILDYRYSGFDLILGAVSNEILLKHLDYLSRAFFTLVTSKLKWNIGLRHDIMSSIIQASHYGLSSESEKKFLLNMIYS